MTCIIFLKLLSPHREDYPLLGELSNVVANYVMKHTFTIWLNMKYVCIHLSEQLPNLKEYFLKFLPKTNQYNELKKTESYQRIKSILADPISEVYLSFCAFAAGDLSLIEDESCSKFHTESLNVYIVAVNCLMDSLPFDMTVIKSSVIR